MHPVYVYYMHMADSEFQLYRYGYGYIANWQANAVRPHWRIYYNPEPGARVSYGATTIHLDGSQFAVMPPHTPFDQTLDSPCHSLFMHFKMGRSYDRVRDQLFDIPANATLTAMAKRVINGFEAGESRHLPHNRFNSHALIYGVMGELPDAIWQHDIRDERLEAIMDKVEENPLMLWSNEELARQAHLSPNAFVRLFRQCMGTPPQTYLRQRRLQEAALLLSSTDMSVDHIAEHCGFCDRHYFSRCFRQLYFCGPATYRKQSDDED